jgi:protein involved in polysaccharide export with SLBB domain
MRTIALVAFAIAVGTVAPLAAQSPPDIEPGRSERTRADLERLLAFYQEALESPAYSSAVKATLREDAETVRRRLSEGDFRLGDRIVLTVAGEPELPDTVPVEAGPLMNLPLFGDISLRGVLRSEIEEHLTKELGAFIRDPRVRAQALMRLSIQGSVGDPGFFVVPADMLLTEALMVAGGPTGNSNLDRLRVERGGEVLLEGDEAQEALRLGRTLDQLNLEAGDQVVLPERTGGFFSSIGLITGVIGSVTYLIYLVAR